MVPLPNTFFGTFHNILKLGTPYLFLHRYQRKKLPNSPWGVFGKNHCREYLIDILGIALSFNWHSPHLLAIACCAYYFLGIAFLIYFGHYPSRILWALPSLLIGQVLLSQYRLLNNFYKPCRMTNIFRRMYFRHMFFRRMYHQEERACRTSHAPNQISIKVPWQQFVSKLNKKL